MSDELKFSGDIKKPECIEMLSDAGIPFDPTAKVADLRDLLCTAELALAVKPEVANDAEAMVEIEGLKNHRCEMNGQVIKFAPKDRLELMYWKAEKLVAYGVARFI